MTNLKIAQPEESMATFGLSRNKGPADGLHQIASVLQFTEHAMVCAQDSVCGEGLFYEDSLAGLIELTKACHTEIDRIAKVTPAFAPAPSGKE